MTTGFLVAALSLAPSIAPATLAAPPVLPDDASLLVLLYQAFDVQTADEQREGIGTENEAALEQCMTDAGFQYSDPSRLTSNDPSVALSAEEFAEQFGLGITSQTLGLYPAPPIDPNDEYIQTLQEAERNSYFAAMNTCGDEIAPDAEVVSAALADATETFRGVVDSDPSVVDALEGWRQCMSTGGFSYDNPTAMRTVFYDSAYQADADLRAVFAEEVLVAIHNVPCESAYLDVVRDVLTDRFPEFKDLVVTHLESSSTGDAVG